jgi:hypothetical protein
LRARSLALWKALASVIGPDEILLVVALTLVTVALWPWVGQGALLPAGLVLLFVALPSRAPFVHRQPIPEKPTRRQA